MFVFSYFEYYFHFLILSIIFHIIFNNIFKINFTYFYVNIICGVWFVFHVMYKDARKMSHVKQVSEFEFNLLRILKFIYKSYPLSSGAQLIKTKIVNKEPLSDEALHLIKDILSKGTVLFLVRSGGWRNDKYLKDNHPVEGRVWERIPLEDRTLTFSYNVLSFLIWITKEEIHKTQEEWECDVEYITPADEIFFWHVFNACISDHEIMNVLCKQKVFNHNLLCWITSAYYASNKKLRTTLPDMPNMCVGLRSVVMECVQSYLVDRILLSEKSKPSIKDWNVMRIQGNGEYQALNMFIKQAEETGRKDLAKFILNTNYKLLQSDLKAEFWHSGLTDKAPSRLADRLETRRASLALPRQMAELSKWYQQAMEVGYFDEDYQASQLFKDMWEKMDGNNTAMKAKNIVDSIDPLQPQV